MVLFTSFYSVQNMVSQVFAQLDYGNLGNISLLTMYISYGMASFFSTYIMRLCSVRTSFLLSALAFNVFIAMGFFVESCPMYKDEFYCSNGFVYAYILFGSLVTGIASSVIWIASAVYIDDMSEGFEKWRSGQFVGLFYAAYQIS